MSETKTQPADLEATTHRPAEQPAERPRYLVRMEPGAYIQGVGFRRPGEEFTGPLNYVPSRTFWPLNEAAAKELEKVKARYSARRERTFAPGPEESIRTEVFRPPAATLHVVQPDVVPDVATQDELVRLADRKGGR